MKKKVIIIGSGFSSLSAASYLAKGGFEVEVYEKNDSLGGRARIKSKNGFTFDMGPSWYWMPDVFENFFSDFGKQVSDYYNLVRLSPSYRVFWEDTLDDIPASMQELEKYFEKYEPPSRYLSNTSSPVLLVLFCLKFPFVAGNLIFALALEYTSLNTKSSVFISLTTRSFVSNCVI